MMLWSYYFVVSGRLRYLTHLLIGRAIEVHKELGGSTRRDDERTQRG
jgi:hypothetical protein